MVVHLILRSILCSPQSVYCCVGPRGGLPAKAAEQEGERQSAGTNQQRTSHKSVSLTRQTEPRITLQKNKHKKGKREETSAGEKTQQLRRGRSDSVG